MGLDKSTTYEPLGVHYLGYIPAVAIGHVLNPVIITGLDNHIIGNFSPIAQSLIPSRLWGDRFSQPTSNPITFNLLDSSHYQPTILAEVPRDFTDAIFQTQVPAGIEIIPDYIALIQNPFLGIAPFGNSRSLAQMPLSPIPDPVSELGLFAVARID